MEKKSLFDPGDFAALRARIENLGPEAPRQWGKMDAAQMLAHVNVPLEAGLGKLALRPEGNALTRRLLRWYVLSRTVFQRNLPTSPQFIIVDVREFDREKQRLLRNLDEAQRRGLQGPWSPHNSFGELQAWQWGSLTWMHLDHHLRQFGG